MGYIQASELEMMIMKTGAEEGALLLLAEKAIEWLEKFTAFPERFKELRTNCMVLGFGTLSPIIPDHLIREHAYYISKIEAYMKRD